jgi:hypothetical protein
MWVCRIFVRISHDEVSISHPDEIRKILLDSLRKVQTKGHYSGICETYKTPRQVDWYKIMALPDRDFQTPMSEVDPKR